MVEPLHSYCTIYDCYAPYTMYRSWYMPCTWYAASLGDRCTYVASTVHGCNASYTSCSAAAQRCHIALCGRPYTVGCGSVVSVSAVRLCSASCSRYGAVRQRCHAALCQRSCIVGCSSVAHVSAARLCNARFPHCRAVLQRCHTALCQRSCIVGCGSVVRACQAHPHNANVGAELTNVDHSNVAQRAANVVQPPL